MKMMHICDAIEIVLSLARENIITEQQAGENEMEDERQKQIELAARKLENALGSFRVEATVVGAKVGPAVTMFELEITQGTRMNKVTALAQEIAAALRAKSVRIIAPIPGKGCVGIEVSMPHTSMAPVVSSVVGS